MPVVAVTGSFDDMRSRQVRFLEQAAKRGDLHVALWSDSLVEAQTGKAPKFPLEERRYFVEALRYVSKVSVANKFAPAEIMPASVGGQSASWLVDQAGDTPALKQFSAQSGLAYQVISDQELTGFPLPPALTPLPGKAGRKKVLITGCYDWFHTGHVRFFEEVSEYGAVYAVVGHDANIALLKGAGHPQFSQDERVYMVGSIRYVTQALISSGMGYLDAEPEILKVKPDIYAVNEDGDKPEKKEYCQKHGIDYLVLKRLPKAGLPKRQSTDLRGF